MSSPDGVFKWNDANTADLIVWRVSNSSLFTGKRNAAIKAYELYVKEKHLEGKVTPAWVRKKWENLKQKYKDLKSLTVAGADTAVATWKWYAIMDSALSSETPVNHFITPVQVSLSAQEAPPIKQKKQEDCLVDRRLGDRERLTSETEDERDRRAAEREDERDRRAAERELERDRRAAEREDARERQALEREERREREMFAREERWEKEMLAREERLERDYREREERRERAAAAREERLFKLLETFLANR